MKNNDGRGGLNKGVAWEFEATADLPDWRRSVFNGLAEVIVQANQDAGEIKLTASADNLSSGEIVIRSESYPQGRRVP